MSDNSHIEWCDATWNPLRALRTDYEVKGWHCERVSPGCQNCYAETLNEKRFGTGLPYNRKSRDRVETFLDEVVLMKPLHWRKSRRIFVCSMTDLFGEWVKDEWIDQVFAVMALAPQHTFIILTKRPERMREYLTQIIHSGGNLRMGRAMVAVSPSAAERWVHAVGDDGGDFFPLPNVHLGVSAENQETLDARVPVLLDTPAAVRVVSLEPLLGPVGFNRWHGELWTHWLTGLALKYPEEGVGLKLDHVIVGGESGPHARPCDIGWIRSVVQQCQAASVPVFCKQLGSNPTGAWFPDGYEARRPAAWKPVKTAGRWRLSSGHGSDMDEWPEDLRVREWPV